MNTSNQSTVRALALLVLAIAIIAGGYFYQTTRESALAGVSKTTSTATTSTAQFMAVAPGQDTSKGTTSIIPIQATTYYKQPGYPKQLVFKGAFSAADRKAMQDAYDTAQSYIVTDKYDFNAWISIGTMNLMSGNYATAESVWQYASQQWPTNQVSHNNLGDLYANYLKDYPKAEKEWLAAITNKGDDPTPYRNLFTLYSETSYKPTNTAAEDILKKGIAANPKLFEIRYMLAVYYKKLGRTQDAQAMFNAAADTATQEGQPQMAEQIKIDAAK